MLHFARLALQDVAVSLFFLLLFEEGHPIDPCPAPGSNGPIENLRDLRSLSDTAHVRQ